MLKRSTLTLAVSALLSGVVTAGVIAATSNSNGTAPAIASTKVNTASRSANSEPQAINAAALPDPADTLEADSLQNAAQTQRPVPGSAVPPTAQETDAVKDFASTPVGASGTSANPAANGSPAASAPPVSTWTAESINTAEWNESITEGQHPVFAKAQVLLERGRASSGVIDGTYGRNMMKAIAAYELMQGLPVDGKMDADVWAKLEQHAGQPEFTQYSLTEKDVKGPYVGSIPRDYALQAKMKTLGYTSIYEMLGEKFHMDVEFLKQLNKGKSFSKAGDVITIASVGQVDNSPISLLIAHKGASELYGFDANNKMIVAYPATIGSDETPSPSGKHTIRAISPNPHYGYDPKNFIQGKNLSKLTLPPGPNNPVGLMWIALSKPSFGIHGTPEPSRIDKTRSHGCVRLTNWHAIELSKRIKVGTPVQFEQ